MKTHILSRGVILGPDRTILLAQAIGHDFTFLPGGHLDPDESLVEAVAREVKEEIGLSCQVGDYLGAVEFQWPPEAPTNYEINHLFLVEIDTTQPVQSQESHIRFLWCRLDQLDEARLEPAPLRPLIRRFLSGDRTPWWATNVAKTWKA